MVLDAMIYVRYDKENTKAFLPKGDGWMKKRYVNVKRNRYVIM